MNISTEGSFYNLFLLIKYGVNILIGVSIYLWDI